MMPYKLINTELNNYSHKSGNLNMRTLRLLLKRLTIANDSFTEHQAECELVTHITITLYVI